MLWKGSFLKEFVNFGTVFCDDFTQLVRDFLISDYFIIMWTFNDV